MNKDAENSFYLYVTMASNQETGVISKKNINIVQIHKKLEFLLGTQLANDIYIYICVYQNILLMSNEYYFIIHTLTSKESVYKRPTQY